MEIDISRGQKNLLPPAGISRTCVSIHVIVFQRIVFGDCAKTEYHLQPGQQWDDPVDQKDFPSDKPKEERETRKEGDTEEGLAEIPTIAGRRGIPGVSPEKLELIDDPQSKCVAQKEEEQT